MSFLSFDKAHNLDQKLTKHILKKKLKLNCVEKLKLRTP